MDVTTLAAIAKNAVDMAKNENVLNKSADIMGMLFPFAGTKQKALEVYINDIEKSDLPSETKVFMILNAKKTFKKIKNQRTIAEIAMDNAKEGTDFSEKSGVKEEWLDRFMESASFVSSEEMQLIWGKILANEFERPGSTPPNMIRVLSEITPELARAFRCICSMFIWVLPLKENDDIKSCFLKIFVPFRYNDEEFVKMGVGFNVINELEALGILKFESVRGFINKSISSEKVLIYVDEKLELVDRYTINHFPTGNVILTSVGEALRKITEVIEIDDYYRMVKKYMEKNGVTFATEHDYMLKEEDDGLRIYKNVDCR